MDRWPDSAARQVAWEVYQRLDALDPVAVGACTDEFSTTPYLRFANDAQDLFRDWRGKLETRLRGDELHPALEAHLAKYRKLVPSFGLILHLADAGHGPIGHRATLQACAWAEYLERHAKRLYASVSVPEIAAAKAILSRLNRSDLQSPFAGRDIYRKGWALLSERDEVYSALQLLTDLDWIRPATVETSGRPATVYHVNPKASR